MDVRAILREHGEPLLAAVLVAMVLAQTWTDGKQSFWEHAGTTVWVLAVLPLIAWRTRFPLPLLASALASATLGFCLQRRSPYRAARDRCRRRAHRRPDLRRHGDRP